MSLISTSYFNCLALVVSVPREQTGARTRTNENQHIGIIHGTLFHTGLAVHSILTSDLCVRSYSVA